MESEVAETQVVAADEEDEGEAKGDSGVVVWLELTLMIVSAKSDI